MANEMHPETLKKVLAITEVTIDNFGAVNGAELGKEYKHAFKILVQFAAKWESGVESFKDTLDDLSGKFAEIGAAIEDHKDWSEWMQQDVDPTESDLHKQWREEHLPHVARRPDGSLDTDAASEDFNNWTDALCKEGEISDLLYRTIEHPAECAD